MSVDLVIFDCDGVLVDSEIISCRVFAQALTHSGYPITADQVHDRFLGRSSRETRREVERELGRMLPDDFHAQLNVELFRQLETSLEPMPHIAQALDALAQPVCVASSGPPQKIGVSLNRVGLYDRFAPHIFSATQVARGKPAPDLFLFAAAQMGADPARCLVIEDSVAGITAARAAGMATLGFAGGSHCRPGHGQTLRQAGARAAFDDMRQLTDLIVEI
ncbi:HAD family hydrolase [Rhodopseudomonas palustris]|uniref:HAD-superfamily hydrolase subfamily IA, variant 3 n=1 Tax=Rhodopseudomonas palustris (strain BisB18) TaxID=316056 RepID=Q21C44_RHOPB